MNRPDPLPPSFPQFTWNGHAWMSSAKLPAWAGYQIREGAYGGVSSTALSDGVVRIRFAPEGRHADPLSENEIALVQWLIDNEAAVHHAMLEKLFDEYPNIRDQWLSFFDKEEASEILPRIKHPEQLKKIVGVSFINVHQISKNGIPFIGVELGCTWEQEHGLGILLHGTTALELGGADTAFLLWIARKYAK
jgi:hypothetical protein